MSKIVRRAFVDISEDIFYDDDVVKMSLNNCNFGSITEIERFPINLEVLELSASAHSQTEIPKITNLPLPLNLVKLSIYLPWNWNDIDLSGVKLPMGLKHLFITIRINSEEELPELPDSLETVLFRCFNFDKFTRPFPKNLKSLSMDICSIREIPKGLPDGLKVLKITNSFDELFGDDNHVFKPIIADDLPGSLDEIHLNGNNIETISGRLPENLKVLNLGFNSLKDTTFNISGFPCTLTNLDLSGNSFTRRILDSLPQSIKQLRLYRSEIIKDNCEYELPRDLEYLDMDLRYGLLPDRLPDGIKEVHLTNINIVNEIYETDRLPIYIPEGVEVIDIANSTLKELPENLPDSLELLKICASNISSFPKKLPINLVKLQLSKAQLTEIPENLPNTLEQLVLENNFISVIPDNLPVNLKKLNLCNNPIKSIPNNLPKELQRLALDNTLIGKCLSGVSHSKLTYLSLKFTLIEEIRDCDFGTLWMIDLRDSPIRKIESNTFTFKTKLLTSVSTVEIENSVIGWQKRAGKFSKFNIEAMDNRITENVQRDLHYYADFIKGHFEFWSLREEGTRFHQAHKDFLEIFS